MMAEQMKTFDGIQVGDRLPEFVYTVTATTVVQGAAASRDWQPQHHDSAWAHRVGTKDIFVNTPTQGGWICRYVTNWSGPHARIGRITYRMRASVYPGDELRFNGTVTAAFVSGGIHWIALSVELSTAEAVKTIVEMLIALPASENGASPWSRSVDEWRLPPMPTSS